MGFLIGATATGNGPALVRSMSDYEDQLGARAGFEAAYDAADAYFREGGSRLTVSRTDPGTGRSSSKAKASDAEAPVATALDPTVQAALDALTKDLGPGQVFIADPGIASVLENQQALLDHCQACNRVALLTPLDGDATSLLAAATALKGYDTARYGALFAPQAVIPGIAGGTSRTVPYSAIEAGIIGRNDAFANPNVASAGDLGQAVYATDLTTRYTDQEYADLNAGGVDLAKLVYGGVRTYGYRTVVDPQGSDSDWLELGWARLNMAIVADAAAVGEHYVFSQIDGRGRTISAFGAGLSAMLVPFYEAGALYGDTADDAFQVNVGPSVNTPTTIANGELHAVLAVRMSPFAEWVVIEIVKVATTEAIAA
jgi:hypothetical protein